MIVNSGLSMQHPWRLRWLAVAVALMAWAAFALFAPTALQQADERATDLIWQFSAHDGAERRVVVVDIDDDELKRAPSFRADKDFDWGDRSQEAELHRYYGIPPYWSGF